MKYSVFFSLLFLFSNFVKAQSPAISWQKTLGGTGSDDVRTVIQKPDNTGYYVIGKTNSPSGFELTQGSYGLDDIWVVCLNNNGNLVWENVYGGVGSDGLISKALLYNDKLYVVTASSSGVSGNKTTDSFGNMDIWLLCLDLEGNIEWQRSYGGTEADLANIIEVHNDTLHILGYSESGVSGNKTTPNVGDRDFWLLKIDPNNGDKLAERTIGSLLYETPFSLSFDDSGNIYLLGTSLFGVSGDKTVEGYGAFDLWLVKIDSDLEIVNQACFGSAVSEETPTMMWYDNKLYLSCGISQGNSGNVSGSVMGSLDAWVFCLNENLEIIWQNILGGSAADVLFGITIWNDKLTLIGHSNSFPSGSKQSPNYGGIDYWLVFVDRHFGGLIKEQSYGGNGSDIFTSIDVLSNNNLLVAGISNSGISGLKTEPNRGGSSDIWVLKLNASSLVSLESNELTDLIVYPNPSSGLVYFQVPQELLNGNLELYSMDGKLIKSVFINEINFCIDLTDISGSQMLMFKYTHAHGISSGKISKI